MRKYIGLGQHYSNMPARDLSDDEWKRRTAGRTKAEMKLLGQLYKYEPGAPPVPGVRDVNQLNQPTVEPEKLDSVIEEEGDTDGTSESNGEGL